MRWGERGKNVDLELRGTRKKRKTRTEGRGTLERKRERSRREIYQHGGISAWKEELLRPWNYRTLPDSSSRAGQ